MIVGIQMYSHSRMQEMRFTTDVVNEDHAYGLYTALMIVLIDIKWEDISDKMREFNHIRRIECEEEPKIDIQFSFGFR